MKHLVRLLLINWYRLEQASIELQGHTAVIGPNASGKSSLLDAIQAVLVGGDKRWWNPNASAGEKSTRSLRDYCLGVVRDPSNPDLSLEFRPREQALSYLALVFRDDVSGEAISLGLALHARLEEAQEVIDGRFIAPGLDLVLSDLVDRGPLGAVPKPWKRLREELRQRLGERLQVHAQVGEYHKELCHILYDGRRSLDPPHFLRAFRNAITFAPIRNVSDFVRTHILEERPIQVRSLQQALHHYRDIQTRTREARQREEALVALDQGYRRADQAERLGLAWRWVEHEAAFNAREAELEPQRLALERVTSDLGRLQRHIEDLDRQWHAADVALTEANRRLAATHGEQRRERLQAEQQVADKTLNEVNQAIDQARLALGAVHRLLDQADHLDDPALVQALQTLPPLLRRDEGLLTVIWPQDPAAVMAALDRLAPRLAAALVRLRERYDQLVVEEREMDLALQALRARIDRLERGESDLRPATLRLIALLGEHGIPAVPLCDRVDVADEAWREALEAFLGGHREALLVDPDQVREAIGLYRREGRRRDIHGSRVINTLGTAAWSGAANPGSLAAMVVSADVHALAYIRRRADRVLRVDSEDELLGQERAITADGMLAAGGAVSRLTPMEPMLGREARRLRLQVLKDQFAQEGEAHYRKQQDKRVVQDLREGQLMPLNDRLRAFPNLVSLAAQRERTQGELARLAAEAQALLSNDAYQGLVAEVERHQAAREALASARNRATREATDRELRRQALESSLASLEEASQAVAERRRAIRQTPGFPAPLAAERLEELQAQAVFAAEDPDAWRALGSEAGRRAGAQEKSAANHRLRAREDLANYWAAWSPDQRPALGAVDDHLGLAAWVARELTQVRETQLARYVTEADNALREAEFAFRADFVGKLQENLQTLEESRRELNRSLRSRPFHGQYYSFVKQPAPDLKDILDWVLAWSPEQGGDVGGLFDAASDPNHPHCAAIARVRDLLMEAAGGEGRTGGWDERLADYRQYYHFDVRMSDDKEGGGNPEFLSRRLGKGSGGEHQSPFYVAIGAALAAAYRIERDQDGRPRGGMALAVFDEAFSKLDLQNTVSALGFLDELGLQVLLAAPDEKYGQIAEHVDTIVNVYRDGGSVHIDTEQIKAAARQALAADNPVPRPDR